MGLQCSARRIITAQFSELNEEDDADLVNISIKAGKVFIYKENKKYILCDFYKSHEALGDSFQGPTDQIFITGVDKYTSNNNLVVS